MKSALFVVLMMLATGAAARDKDSDLDAASSQALKIARAAHLDKLRDAPAAEIPSAEANFGSEHKNGGSSLAVGAIGVGQAAKVFRAPRGFSQGGAAATSLGLAVLTSLPVAVPENSPRLLMRVSTASANSPQDAREQARGILLNALAQTMPEANVRFVEQQDKVQAHLAMDLPDCTRCRITWLGLQDYVKPKVEKTPEFLGGGENYVWGHPKKQGDGLLAGYPWNQESMTRQSRQDFLLKFSSKLPAEIYIYLPPNPLVADYPVILHQGEVLLFERPGVSATAATAQTQPHGGAGGSSN